MKNRDEYIKKMQAKLEEWNTEIDALTAKAGEMKADVRIEYNELIEALKVKQVGARQKIEELEKAGESAWEDLKTGIDHAWASIKETIDVVKSRFR